MMWKHFVEYRYHKSSHSIAAFHLWKTGLGCMIYNCSSLDSPHKFLQCKWRTQLRPCYSDTSQPDMSCRNSDQRFLDIVPSGSFGIVISASAQDIDQMFLHHTARKNQRSLNPHTHCTFLVNITGMWRQTAPQERRYMSPWHMGGKN